MALEYREGDCMVIRADLPEIDPDHDIEIWIADDILHIRANRQAGHEPKDHSSDVRYGLFTRDICLPAGTAEDMVSATYQEGQLEVRAPHFDPVQVVAVRIPVVH